MIDAAIAQLVTVASGLPAINVRPSTEVVRVNDGVQRILFTCLTAPRTYNDDGPDGITIARYQFDHYAPQLSTARATAKAVRDALEAFTGEQAGVKILRFQFPDTHFGSGQVAPGANNLPARLMQDVTVIYRD